MREYKVTNIKNSLKAYYRLTKPGIIYGNIIFAAAGFLLASKGRVDFGLLASTLAGTSLVIASACVFNNYIDRNIDRHMARTKNRALAAKTITGTRALIYAIVLGAAGFIVLAALTNRLVVFIGAMAFLIYVVVYTAAKRTTLHSTLIGSLAGAAPPLAGYCAVTNRLDSGGLLLFLILVLWQMPHFYAIAIYRYKDYKAAGLPVLPIKHGIKAAKLQIVIYISAFIAAIMMLGVLGYTGYTYLAVVGAVSLAWLRLAVNGFSKPDSQKWARSIFRFSLVVTLVFSFMLSLEAWLP